MTYLRINKGDIEVGRPVPWALYDEGHHLLLARGMVVENEGQKQALMERGLYRKMTPPGPRVFAETGPEPGLPTTDDLCALEDVKLDIGDTLQLTAQADDARHYVKLIGFLKGKSVIVTTPTQDGRVLLMREGQNFVVRMFSGKSVYAFSSSIHKVANVPYPHLHLTYPAQVRGLVVRRGARARVNILAAVAGSDGRIQPATLLDLSTGGAMLSAKAPFGIKDDRVTIKFRVVVSEVEQYVMLKAVLRSVRAAPGGEGDAQQVMHGVQFEDLAHADQVLLSAFVYRLLFEDAAEI